MWEKREDTSTKYRQEQNFLENPTKDRETCKKRCIDIARERTTQKEQSTIQLAQQTTQGLHQTWEKTGTGT